MITATGLGSGLDIGGLVSQLVAAERAGSDLQLERQNSKLKSKFSALGSLKGALSSFQSSLSTLNNLGTYGQKSASSSSAAELGLSVNNTAVPNNYSIEINQLAKAHALASTAFADSDTTAIGTGAITIRFGTTDYTPGTDTYTDFTLNPDSSVATINIDSSNNTLDGIMAAINEADVGVSAAIVNDGSGFRLLISSNETGLENSLEISVNDDDANNSNAAGLSHFAFNASATNMVQTAAAQDAEFTLNGLAVSAASNEVSTAIPGVTLVLKTTTTVPVSVSVKADSAAVTSGVKSFVAGYNAYINTVKSLSAYDPEKNIPAALVGDFTLRSIRGQIDSILYNPITGLTGDLKTLSEVGITTNKSGLLELDEVKLNSALTNYPDRVSKIFAAQGVPTDGEILYKESSTATLAGNYAVNITALATAGVFNAAGVLPNFGGGGTVTINANNNNLTFEVDGITTSQITLTSGVYSSGAALAAEIQTQLNGVTELRASGNTVSVTYDAGNNRFSITSGTLGSTSTIKVLAIDTNTAADMGFSIGSGVAGIDVAGTIDGIAAVGAGNVLVAASGSGAEGLGLTINGTATGSRGSVNFSRGSANQIDMLLDQFLDLEGALEERISAFEDRIEEVAERKAKLELRWEAVEARYSRQFNALDTLLASLQGTSSYMESQFKNLLSPNTGRNA